MRKAIDFSPCAPLLLILGSVGCAQPAPPVQDLGEFSQSSQVLPYVIAEPAAQFFANISPYCGKAYLGKIVADQPASNAPDPFEGKPLVMHVRSCENRNAPTQEIRIPFHVGGDRSRTWVVTRTLNGLRLKHDHRHEDGSSDAMTMYGGETVSSGAATRQEFPVDAESVSLFQREGRSASSARPRRATASTATASASPPSWCAPCSATTSPTG